MKEVETRNPGIFSDPLLLWNFDESGVLTEFGKKKKICGPTDKRGGGSVSNHIGSGKRRHVTTVFAVSAFGLKSPPFIIVEGKNVMSTWLENLDREWY